MDWKQVLTEHLQNLIRLDTTNPPGQETKAVDYLAQHLAASGIWHQTFEPAPGRGSVVARLPGDGSERPLLLLAHLDVVMAHAAEWTVPPFSGQEAEQMIWGRGAIDTKNLVATWLTLMQMFAAEQVLLRRDIVFAATADEEAGGRMGLGWLVEHHPELVDCEYCLNEGGGNAMQIGSHTYFTLQSGEKASAEVKLTASGTAGHASIPLPDNAVAKLAAAIGQISAAKLPVHLTRTVESFIGVLARDAGLPASIAPEQTLDLMGQYISSPFERAAISAMLQNTACPTILEAGQKLNVAPSRATAYLDGRVLPGQSGADLERELAPLVAGLADLAVGPHLPATESEPETALTQVIRDVISRQQPGAKLIPFLSPGATDARYLRPRGAVVYGFAPMLPGELVQLAHGVDERISLRSLHFGLDVLEEVVRRIAAK